MRSWWEIAYNQHKYSANKTEDDEKIRSIFKNTTVQTSTVGNYSSIGCCIRLVLL